MLPTVLSSFRLCKTSPSRPSVTTVAWNAGSSVGHDGCLECRVFEDVSVSSRFLWSQWWRSQRQLESHLGSVAFRTLLGAIKVLGTLESARTLDLQDATSVMGALLTDRVNMTDQPSET
jgi:quinol monooxygenase YgiN